MPDPATKETVFFLFRLICMFGFAITLAAGFYLAKNRRSLLAVDPLDPSETASARSYNTMQVVAIWAHCAVFFAMGSLVFH